jgi:hypothetical protein
MFGFEADEGDVEAAMQQQASDHNRIDARNLAFHRLIASKVAADPALVTRAIDLLGDEELANYNATQEWLEILSWPIDQIVDFLTGNSAKLVQLCQSTPFLGVISEEERRTINESYGIRARYPGS